MGSRCGHLDPSVIMYLIDVLGLQVTQVRGLLNKKMVYWNYAITTTCVTLSQ